MGKIDTRGKEYFSDPDRFADLFNYLIFDGRDVIKGNELQELDTAQIAIPFRDKDKIHIQKQRDLFRLWNAKMDDKAIYLLLGAEFQNRIHYALPVKNGLYDMIGYSAQVSNASKEMRAKDDEGEIVADADSVRIHISGDEFLSGFKKTDRLKPIITATVCFSPDKWDGPLSLHEMFEDVDESILRFVPDYKINLISPADMPDEDFDKFSTHLSYAMMVMKYQRSKADEIIEKSVGKIVDRETADFLNDVANLGLEFDEKGADVNMCQAMENRVKKEQVRGAITMCRIDGMKDEDIIVKIKQAFGVDEDYIKALLVPKTA